MAKIIRGTRDSKGTTILKGGNGGMRKIRCGSCHAFATEQTMANGKVAYVCQCGAVYNMRPL